MSIEDTINHELASRKLLPLNEEQVRCLHDPERLEEAAGMLADLRDRCGLRLPLPGGFPVGGPYDSEREACQEARLHRADFPVVVVDRMATDESRGTGVGDEYYATGYSGADAALALAAEDGWVACWLHGSERSSEI